MIQHSAKTNIGQRKANEDNFFIDEKLGLYIVADGVGGLAKGEVASQLTCETIHASVKQGKTLSEAVMNAHHKIIEETKSNEQLKGMASTVIVAKFDGNAYELAWIGDSRAYLWDGGLKLISRDHSYIELLLETGHITYEQMRTHPDKNVISQALGIERKELKVATNSGTLEKDQILMLSTDGLYEIVQEIQVIKQITKMVNIKSLTTKLVNYAVNSDGRDNITLLTIQSDSDSENNQQVIQPIVIREFDSETGEVISNESETNVAEEANDNSKDNKLTVKSITPRVVETENSKVNEKVKASEVLLLLLIIIAILIIVTLNL